jgi:hypothetical protein
MEKLACKASLTILHGCLGQSSLQGVGKQLKKVNNLKERVNYLQPQQRHKMEDKPTSSVHKWVNEINKRNNLPVDHLFQLGGQLHVP